MATSSSEIRDRLKGQSLELTKPVVTASAQALTATIADRINAKMKDRLNSNAKSASSATQSITSGLGSIAGQIDTARALAEMQITASSRVKNLAGSLVKGKDSASAALLKDKAGGILGGAFASGKGESAINEKLADTIATTGPQDELITEDAYGFTGLGGSILSEHKGRFSDLAKSIGNSFRGGGGLAATAASLLSFKNGKVGLDTNVLKNRLVHAVGGKAGLINSLGASTLGPIIGGMAGNDALSNRISTVIDGTVRAIRTDDIRSARGLFNLIGQVVGDNGLVDFIDESAKTQVISQIYREAIALGIPEAIDLVIERTANDRDNSAIYGLTYSISDAVSRSDLKTIGTMIDQLGADAVFAAVPNAVEHILATYRFPYGTADAQHPALWTELDTLLRRLDPRWYEVQRGDSWLIDMGVLTSASTDALTLVRQSSDLYPVSLFAREYPKVSLIDQAQRMFPYAAF